MYSAIATRKWGEGRILIHSDSIDGYETSKGANNLNFWRKVIEFTSQKTPQDIIRIGLIRWSKTANNLFSLKNVIVENIDLTYNLNNYDLIYITGNEELSTEYSDKIKDFINMGGGIIIESINNGTIINPLKSIEIINVSIVRPNLNKAYWTLAGNNSYIYDKSIFFEFCFKLTDLSSYWTTLMSDIEVLIDINSSTVTDNLSYKKEQSKFSISFTSVFKDGIITINE